ncbi:helix-turn-helix transcriptional regulator [Chryseobacterium luquanense]|uniref:LuxR C-terminal-related transcriptional regulator n=1 Tax=Chryseobacterium luquanense TaxID=2983766 RepID=A0ABT3XY14_9FLAO|nr:LuxR C-terminal-related transcriptional regulator [Chryseobacterium luquanense]MCX8530765.1 LuxR C-terminal-related transcriptional regulator [Chryseobacterium luquanense]
MAKKKDPLFLTRFKEIYPDLHENLITYRPNLKTSELTLCAYLYFGFTSKEIANYTFRSIKTIDNNRHNLRKKLDLTSEIDLCVWLKKMADRQDSD